MARKKAESLGDVRSALEALTPREAKVLRMRLGISVSSKPTRIRGNAPRLRTLALEIVVPSKKKKLR